MANEFREGLGAGVYVALEQGRLKLTSELRGRVMNTIYLDLDVYRELVEYVDRVLTGARTGDQGQ